MSGTILSFCTLFWRAQGQLNLKKKKRGKFLKVWRQQLPSLVYLLIFYHVLFTFCNIWQCCPSLFGELPFLCNYVWVYWKNSSRWQRNLPLRWWFTETTENLVERKFQCLFSLCRSPAIMRQSDNVRWSYKYRNTDRRAVQITFVVLFIITLHQICFIRWSVLGSSKRRCLK
jgi:hypothetical protein